MSGVTYEFTCRRCGQKMTETVMCGSPPSTLCGPCWGIDFDERMKAATPPKDRLRLVTK